MYLSSKSAWHAEIRWRRAEESKGVYTMYPPWSCGRSQCLYTRKICNWDNSGVGLRPRLRGARLARVVFWRRSKGVKNNGRRGRRETRGRPIWDWNITARPNMYGGHGEIYMPASIRVHTRAHKRAALKCTPNVVGRLQRRRRARNVVRALTKQETIASETNAGIDWLWKIVNCIIFADQT